MVQQYHLYAHVRHLDVCVSFHFIFRVLKEKGRGVMSFPRFSRLLLLHSIVIHHWPSICMYALFSLTTYHMFDLLHINEIITFYPHNNALLKMVKMRIFFSMKTKLFSIFFFSSRRRLLPLLSSY